RATRRIRSQSRDARNRRGTLRATRCPSKHRNFARCESWSLQAAVGDLRGVVRFADANERAIGNALANAPLQNLGSPAVAEAKALVASFGDFGRIGDLLRLELELDD